MLTKRQRDLMDYLVVYTNEHGYAPSFTEMQEHLGLTSKSRVFHLLNSLEERGHIRRLHRRARAIEVLDQPSYANTLPGLTTIDLAIEARRRGFFLCAQVGTSYVPVI